MRQHSLIPEFVEFMPESPAEGVLYVSERFKLAMHRCCCGCGSEVVTPLSPAEWRLTRRGASVSLTPSIGNWSLQCQSHYWIRGNKVEWARPMTAGQIARVRERDLFDKARHIEVVNTEKTHEQKSVSRNSPAGRGLRATLRRWIGR